MPGALAPGGTASDADRPARDDRAPTRPLGPAPIDHHPSGTPAARVSADRCPHAPAPRTVGPSRGPSMSQHSLSQHSLLPSLARPTRRAALAAALLLPLAACSSDPSDGSEAGGAASDGGGTSAEGLTLVDPWVKAAEEGMTSAFGTLTNATGRALQLISASTPSAGMVELHETMGDGSGGMSMQKKEGGFPIPDGGELVLEPGGDHLAAWTSWTC
ncbi:copper chaperone PCu(A)C [Brachybacterium paraconglomeratum]|uniref:copper chaperone PCu(A)C n=2 Tax=Dermabacteraceae TaxID=85020 RepID=UPI0031F04D8C